MALKLYSENDIQDIADAIREKNYTTDTYKVSEMAQAVRDIIIGGGTVVVADRPNGTGTQRGFYVLEDIPAVTVTTGGNVTQELQPDTVYHFTSESLTSLTITFAEGSAGKQYHFDFLCTSTNVTLTLPSSVTMPNDFAVEKHTRYEIDIYDNYGVFAQWLYGGINP